MNLKKLILVGTVGIATTTFPLTTHNAKVTATTDSAPETSSTINSSTTSETSNVADSNTTAEVTSSPDTDTTTTTTTTTASPVEENNHPMGYYAKVQTADAVNPQETQEAANEKATMRAARAAVQEEQATPAANAPADLSSTDKTLPRLDAVDIASYQSWMTQADFNSLKASGVKTIVIKLTESANYTNPYAKSQIQMARNAGLNIDTYHFVSDPTKIQYEAAYYAKVANSLGLSKNTVMIEDAESPSYKYNWTNVSLTFKSTMNSAGYNNIRY